MCSIGGVFGDLLNDLEFYEFTMSVTLLLVEKSKSIVRTQLSLARELSPKKFMEESIWFT